MPRCPICGNARKSGVESKTGPFCSVRCKQVDLGRWLDEKYAVQVIGEPVDEGEEPETNA
jgi:hypothetical protein